MREGFSPAAHALRPAILAAALVLPWWAHAAPATPTPAPPALAPTVRLPPSVSPVIRPGIRLESRSAVWPGAPLEVTFARSLPASATLRLVGPGGFDAVLPRSAGTRGTWRATVPTNAAPGMYTLGAADASGHSWVDAPALRPTLEVSPLTRTVDLVVDVVITCDVDVVTYPSTLHTTFTAPGSTRPPVDVTMTSRGDRTPGDGSSIRTYAARVTLAHSVVPYDVTFTGAHVALRWDLQGQFPGMSTYYFYSGSPECRARRRFGPTGLPLPKPPQKNLAPVGFLSTIAGGKLFLPETTELRLTTTLGTSEAGFGSLPPPTPVCPPSGCQ